MNFNAVFAPTSAAERSIRNHGANLSTYARIAAIIALTGISTTLTFISTHINRVSEYRIRLQLAKVRVARWFVQRAIAAVRVWLNIQADFRAIADSTAKRRRIAGANVRAFGTSAARFMDRVFCLH